MNGVSVPSKIIQKKNYRMKFSRNVRRIVKDQQTEVDKLVNLMRESDKSTGSLHIAPDGLPTIEAISSTDKLRYWAINHNVTRRSVTELLKILKDIGLSWLATDSRTLCKTPRTTDIRAVAGGQYWYNSIENNLRLICSNIKSDTTLKLNFNVDGIPLMKSSATQFWPILANIHSE